MQLRLHVLQLFDDWPGTFTVRFDQVPGIQLGNGFDGNRNIARIEVVDFEGQVSPTSSFF
jgi:hypothetical protein